MSNVIKSVMLDNIDVNGHNRPLDAEHVATLAQSINERGLLEPIWLNDRLNGEDKLALIAGAHRLAAVKKLGLKTVNARIFQVSADVAEELRIIENDQRKNLSEVQIARAYNALADRVGSVATAAALINKPVGHVAKMVSLTSLPEKVLALIESGDLTAAHGFHIARVGASSQEKLVKFVTTKNEYTRKFPTVDDLKREIERGMERRLKDALWPLDHEVVLSAGHQDAKGRVTPPETLPACKGCAYNTAAQVGLFPDLESGHCVNAACFDKKKKWAFGRLQEAALKRHPGMKSLGVKHVSAYSNQVAGGAVLLTKDWEKNKAVQKALKETPEKFGVLITKPNQYDGGKPQVLIAVVDTSILPKSADPHQGGRAREDYERERFVKQTVAQALMTEVADAFAFKKMGLDHWSRMIDKLVSSGSDQRKAIGKACGFDGTKKTFTIDELAKFLFVATFYSWNGADKKEFAGWVKDVNAIAKKTAAAARAEYDAKDAGAEKP